MMPSKKTDNKILITGGSGMVGSQASFGNKPTHKQLDILDPKSIERAILKYKPDVIVHLAALVNMDECETNPKKAFRINVTGAKNIALACKKYNIKIVYLSSCAVFDGKKRVAYTETDRPNPINVYGKTKLQGEQAILKVLPDALIVRTSWLFGSNAKTNKKFFQQAKEDLKKGNLVRAVADRFGSPTYIPDLLNALQKLISITSSGIFHVTNLGVASYLEVVKEIKRVGKFKGSVIPMEPQRLNEKSVHRGKMEGLSSKKIRLRSWKSAMREYLNNQNQSN